MTLSRSLLFNLAGHLLPALLALLAIPPLIAALGSERFGFLALAWLVTGYFGLLDLGLARALTRALARLRDRDSQQEWQSLGIVRDGLLLALLYGLAASALAWLALPWLRQWLMLPTALLSEAHQALTLLPALLCIIIPLNALTGMLEGLGAFARLSLLRLASGIYSYAAPLALAAFSQDLALLVLLLLAGRLMFLALQGRLLLSLLATGSRRQSATTGPQAPRRALWRLAGDGGWLGVSQMAAPLLYQSDRIVLSLRVSLSAVSWYSVPADFLARMSVVSTAIMGVLFPAFSQSFARDPAALHRHYLLAFRLLATSLLPPLLLLALFAEPLLTLWIDTGFARQSAPLVPYLAAALAFSTLAQPAFYLIQAAGRSKTTALLHLAELPVYLTALWLMSGHWGAQGAASAWLLRTVVSCIYLNWLGLRLLRTRLGADAIACRQGQNPPVP